MVVWKSFLELLVSQNVLQCSNEGLPFCKIDKWLAIFLSEFFTEHLLQLAASISQSFRPGTNGYPSGVDFLNVGMIWSTPWCVRPWKSPQPVPFPWLCCWSIHSCSIFWKNFFWMLLTRAVIIPVKNWNWNCRIRIRYLSYNSPRAVIIPVKTW